MTTGFVKLYHLNLTRSAPAAEAGEPLETAVRRRLRHVLWLGGSACSGKSEVARCLAASHGIAVYAADESFERHRRAADPRVQRQFCRVGDLPPEQLWAAPAARQADDLRAFHREHLELIVGDLLRTSRGTPVLVEGACLLPARVAELIETPRQALWLVATPAFRRRHYRRRGPWVAELLARCPQPRRAFARWMERDDVLASWRIAEAERLGLKWWRIDGAGRGQAPAALAAAAAAHFGLGEGRSVETHFGPGEQRGAEMHFGLGDPRGVETQEDRATAAAVEPPEVPAAGPAGACGGARGDNDA